MRQDAFNLKQLLGSVIESMGYELVGVEFHPGRSNALLRIYIDKESGINLDDCERVSHQVSGVLDVEDPIPYHYTLEVSSPGLDRPLFEARHFADFAGRKVRMQLAVAIEGKRKFVGLLKGIENEKVIIEVDDSELFVPLDLIDKARLVPELTIGTK